MKKETEKYIQIIKNNAFEILIKDLDDKNKYNLLSRGFHEEEERAIKKKNYESLKLAYEYLDRKYLR